MWQTLLATIVGGILSFAGSFAAKHWEQVQLRKAMRAAFAAEIGAFLKIAEIRNHEKIVRSWQEPNHEPKIVGGPQDDEPVYAKNVDKIGLLGQEAEKVVFFYSLLKAYRINLRAIERGDVLAMPAGERISFVEGMLSIWLQMKPLGEDLAKRLSPAARAMPSGMPP